MSTFHVYEPRNGHGLAHDPLNSIVAPRPIGWISSLSSSGIRNLAPYSFFNLFNYTPPIIGFASIGWKDSVANINATGSTVLVLNDSIVQYEGSAVKLEHGGVTVSTSKSLATRAGGVTVSPAASVLTEFDVRDVDGRVQIAARKGDLTISDDHGTTTLAQGQETTRDEGSEKDKKGKKREGGGTVPSATGGVLDSPVAVGIGTGVVAGVAAWALIRGDDPTSPSR